MRRAEELYDLILAVARRDDRVRAVILNGSRANPNARPDIFQDFDIIYLVNDLAAFKARPEWIDVFGERMILQVPDEMQNWDPGPEAAFRCVYLIQFMDGNRLDLTLFDIHHLERLPADSLSVLLLDKDGQAPYFAPASDADYLPKPPTPKQFADVCNEFWWISPYVAKGLWRGEIRYALHALEIVREQLLIMLDWYIGTSTQFKQSPGKWGKHLDRFLKPEEWDLLLKTYPHATVDEIWDALIAASDLFRMAAPGVADHFGYPYPDAEDRRVYAHLQHVRALPPDASEIY